MFAQEFDAATFRKGFDKNLVNPYDVRMAVRQSRKYVLDYNASRQIIDLGYPPQWNGDLNLLRHLARSPHQKMWVEFNNRARRERLIEMISTNQSDKGTRLSQIAKPDEVIPRMAWLVETHPQQPSAHRATLITEITELRDERLTMRRVLFGPNVMPFAWYWDVEDNPNVPWGFAVIASMSSVDIAKGDFSDVRVREDIPSLSLGMTYDGGFVGITKGYAVPSKSYKLYNQIAGEFAGELRYIMAFVASLSSVKVINQTTNKAFPSHVVSGRTLPAFEYTEVRITVPRRRKLGKLLSGEAGFTGIKKRNHDVIGYWRTYEHGTGPFCTDEHVWELGTVSNRRNCTKCPAWGTWVPEHDRGDLALGRIEHVKKVVT